MKSITLEDKSYQPNLLHAFYDWLDRLPIPSWLFLLLLFPLIGIVQHLVAYSKGMLAWGEINFDLATAGYWLIGAPLLGIYILKGSTQAWDDFLPLLNLSEQETARLYYEYFNQQPLYRFPRYTATVGILIFLTICLVPLMLDPTAFASQLTYMTTLAFVPLILLMFCLPLTGMHSRVVHEKEALVREANDRIRTILSDINQAAFEKKKTLPVAAG